MTNAVFKTNWDKVLDLLYTRIEPIKVDNFVKPLLPSKVNEREEKIYLLSTMGNASFYQSRANSIKRDLDDCIKEVFGKEYTVEIVDKEPPEELLPQDPSSSAGSELFLNPEYTFESFVAGNENQFPLAACLAVADGFSKSYNPLFLYGESGVGKTHLMHAIGNYVSKNHPKKKVLYVSAETFTTELINAIRHKTQANFKNRFRSIDYLLFDDVQFIAGNASVEEELFNTFETLYSKGKQVVFTSDKPPTELGNFPDRLKSRFSWGMIAQLKQPQYETKLAILKNKAILEDLDINDKDLVDSLDLIAKTNKDNIRELEGSYKRVLSYAAFTNRKITTSLVKETLVEFFKEKKKEITPDSIKKAVSSYYGIKVSDLESKKRSRNIAYPRQIAIYLIREKTSYSFPQIGDCFGGRDHSTIMHSYEKICEEIEHSKDIKTALTNIEKLLEE